MLPGKRTTPEKGQPGSIIGILDLGLLLALGTLIAAIHWQLAGPPVVPSIDVEHVQRALTRSDVTSGDALSVARALGWLALLYLGFSTCLRLLFGLFCRVTDGASWARAGLRLTDFATLPLVRRIVDGAAIGVLVAGIWIRERPSVEASTVVSVGPEVAAVAAAPSREDSEGTLVSMRLDTRAPTVNVIGYSVVEGEILSSIPKRLYGDGTHHTVVLEDIRSSEEAAGERVDNPLTVKADSAVNIAMSGPHLWVQEDQVLYRVQTGDSLWRIAENFLGSGFRWIEIWELNRDQVMTDREAFTNPDLIYPGWTLQLPMQPIQVEQPPQEALPPAPTPPPLIDTPGANIQPSSVAEAEPQKDAAQSDEQVRPDSDGDGLPVRLPSTAPVLATAAGLSAAAATYLLVRTIGRRVRLHYSDHQTRDDKPAQGDVGRVVLASRALMSALQELSFEDSRLTLVREATRYVECFIKCPPGDAEALAGLRHDIGRRLSCGVDAEVLRETSVRFKLSRFQRLAGLLLETHDLISPPLLVPVGGRDGYIYYLNLAFPGGVVIAGSKEQTAAMLVGWLEALAATCSAEELNVLLDEPIRAVIPTVAGMPIVKAQAQESALRLVDEIETMILAREASEERAEFTFVLAFANLDDRSSSSVLDSLLHHGRSLNISIVFVATPDTPGHDLPQGGALLAFSGSAIAQDIEEWDCEGDLVLVAGSEGPLGLYATHVMKESVPVLGNGTPVQLDKSHVGVSFDEDSAQDAQADVKAWHEHEGEPGEVDEEELRPSADVNEVDIEEQSEDPLKQHAGVNLTGTRLKVLGADFQEADGLSMETDPPSHIATQLDVTPAVLPRTNSDGEQSDQEAAPLFFVRCFGRFEILRDGNAVEGWRFSKSRELLAFLLLRDGTPVSREVAIEALCPDALPSQAEKTLYNAIYYLRAALRGAAGVPRDTEIVSTRHHSCQLQMKFFNVDKNGFEAHIRRAERLERGEALAAYEQAFSLYRADLMEEEPYEWAAAARQEYRRRFVEAGRRAGRLALDCRDSSRAIHFFQRVLDRESIDEEAARGLMQAYSAQGDVNGVRKVYKVLCESLCRELEDQAAKPLPDTEALFERFTQRVDR